MDLGGAVGAGAAIAITIKAVDEFSNEFKKAGTSLEGLGKKAAMVAGTVAIAVAGAMVKFGTESVKAAMGAEEAMARFNNTMANSGGKAEEAKGDILRLAGAYVQLGFDDEATAESMGKFYQRTESVTQAVKLNYIAMDLARAKHISLEEASKLVTMAMSGNAKMLKQYGIEISENLTPMEALDELQKKVAGSANEYTKTLAGQTETMKVMWGNIQEEVGGKLLPIMSQLASSFMNEVIPALLPLIAKFGDFAVMIMEKIGPYLPKLMDMFGRLIEVFMKLFEALSPLIGPLLEIVLVIGDALIPILDSLIPIIEMFANVLVPILQLLKPILQLMGLMIGVIMELASGALTKMLIPAFEILGKILTPVIGFIQAIVDVIQWLIEKVTTFFGILGKNKKFEASASVSMGDEGGGGGVIHVGDAIIRPNGQIIETDPRDTLIAMQNPGALGGGGGVTVYIENVNGLDPDEVAKALQRVLNNMIRI